MRLTIAQFRKLGRKSIGKLLAAGVAITVVR